MRCVTMSDQENLGAVNLKWSIDFNTRSFHSRSWCPPKGNIGFEQTRCSALSFASIEINLKIIKGEGKWREPRCTGESSATPSVILRQGIENPWPSRTMTLPFQPNSPPTAMATSINISEK